MVQEYNLCGQLTEQTALHRSELTMQDIAYGMTAGL